MDYLNNMLQKDRDSFVRVCNKLLAGCFLCRDKEQDKLDYYFLLKYREKISDYMSVLGYRVEVNEEYGVIQLTNPMNYNRYQFKLNESIILLILRILYDEKKRELSLGDEIIVTVGDIHDRFAALKIRDKMMDKTSLRNAVATLKRFSIIEALDSDVADEEARIIIYDSILMAVRVENIKQAYERLGNYTKRIGTNEKTDENQAD